MDGMLMDRLEMAEIADVRGDRGPIREPTRPRPCCALMKPDPTPGQVWPAQLLDVVEVRLALKRSLVVPCRARCD
jgi:hypothetical protein